LKRQALGSLHERRGGAMKFSSSVKIFMNIVEATVGLEGGL
jgi:hypothetical protein